MGIADMPPTRKLSIHIFAGDVQYTDSENKTLLYLIRYAQCESQESMDSSRPLSAN
jgi:hypothetical protein